MKLWKKSRPKPPEKNHFYDFDLWTWYGEKIADLIPEGYLVYGEIVGWLPGTDTPIQKNYTYNLPVGECELYVYRVATINAQGTLADLPWDGVKQFCLERGLKWTPELARGIYQHPDNPEAFDQLIDLHLDSRFAETKGWIEEPVRLSDPKTVDEGVCLRQEGIVPTILKAKSGVFLAHETKLLDSGDADLESAA